jgi:signal transduction histidine kinase
MAKSEVEEYTERFDFEVHKHGVTEESVWINWSFTVSKEDGYIYAIGRDVTEQILTAKRERIKSKEVEIAELIANKSTAYIAHFMTELSHSIRNSLTGAIGYIELLQLGVYENEEEFQSYLEMAHESSQEIFNYIASIVDAALESYNGLLKEKRMNDPELSDTLPELSVISISEIMDNLNERMKDKSGIDFDIRFTSENPDVKVISYKESIDKILLDISKVLSYNLDRLVLNINAEDNTAEGAILIQIMDEGNDDLPDLIEVFRRNSSNLIKNIALDKDDILLNFSKIKLLAEQIDCQLTVETFGKGDSNLVQLNIPLKGKMSGK